MAEAGWPADSEEARIIVAFRNFGSPAFASIDYANSSEVPAEVNGRKQPSRSAANDEAIYHVAASP
jgi:hypothetical protein